VSWRLRVSHRTGFRYAGEVLASYNEARMTPLTDLVQTTLESHVDVHPAASTVRYWDYWGTQVTSFDLRSPHTELVVSATSLVETGVAEAPAPATWADLRDERLRDRLVEFLTPTGRTTVDEELADFARDAAGDRPPRQAAGAVADALRAEMGYVPGVTGVHTSAVEAWQERKGVCQDLAHLTVALLRSLGVPARYVSGYLHPVPSAEVGQTVEGESHAWVEWWDGGWTPYDPTNGKRVGPEHVVVARGRDYGDVPPLKGVYAGPPSTTLGVVVEVTRLA